MGSAITTDPIADLLARLRNAQLVNHPSLSVPFSTTKMHLLKLLKTAGYVADFASVKEPKAAINIELTGATRSFQKLRRLSKPGRRLYVRVGEIPFSHGGRGLIIVSTSQGLMSGDEARKRRLGGELICEVY